MAKFQEQNLESFLSSVSLELLLACSLLAFLTGSRRLAFVVLNTQSLYRIRDSESPTAFR